MLLDDSDRVPLVAAEKNVPAYDVFAAPCRELEVVGEKRGTVFAGVNGERIIGCSRQTGTADSPCIVALRA